MSAMRAVLRVNRAKLSRAEILHGDMTWLAIHFLHQCMDSPADEEHLGPVLEDVYTRLQDIRKSQRSARRRKQAPRAKAQ